MARTTLIIPDAIWREVKLRAAKDNKTISDWMTEAIKGKIQPGAKTAGKIKFDDFWISKPMGAFPYPLTRDWIYDLLDHD